MGGVSVTSGSSAFQACVRERRRRRSATLPLPHLQRALPLRWLPAAAATLSDADVQRLPASVATSSASVVSSPVPTMSVAATAVACQPDAGRDITLAVQ